MVADLSGTFWPRQIGQKLGKTIKLFAIYFCYKQGYTEIWQGVDCGMKAKIAQQMVGPLNHA